MKNFIKISFLICTSPVTIPLLLALFGARIVVWAFDDNDKKSFSEVAKVYFCTPF